jgi:hypothetical protein
MTYLTPEDARRMVDDPVSFAEDVLGQDLWSAQRAILRAVRDHPRVAVKACHASGKTKTAAAAGLNWLTRYPDGKVITTAPTWTQVEKLLWAEVHDLARRCALSTWRLNETELRVSPGRYMIGLSTNESGRFQGFHGGHVLVIIDEAPGVRAAVFEAVEGIRAGGDVHVLMLGNPTVPSGAFYDAFAGPGASSNHASAYNAVWLWAGNRPSTRACHSGWSGPHSRHFSSTHRRRVR